MIIEISHQKRNFVIDTEKALDISLAIRRKNNVNAYFIEEPQFEPVRIGSFVGKVSEGGACNCENIQFNAHGNGTHTECVGHITQDFRSVNNISIPHFLLCQVVTANPRLQNNGDRVVSHKDIVPQILDGIDALAIRTTPNIGEKSHKKYSGTNPTYLDPKLAEAIAKKRIDHLLVDTPSVDREEDGGKLQAHKAFWNYPDEIRENATITELIYIPEVVTDGIYILHLERAPFESDATPSKPTLYAIEHA